MSHPETHRNQRIEALDASVDGATTIDSETRPAVYAGLATAHAVLHLAEILVDVRNELEATNTHLREIAGAGRP